MRYVHRVVPPLREAFLVFDGAVACHGYSYASGEILRPYEDHPRLTHVTASRSSIKNESVGIEDDQIPS